MSCVDEPEASSREAAVLSLEALGLIPSDSVLEPRVTHEFNPRAGTIEAHRAGFQKRERLRAAILTIT